MSDEPSTNSNSVSLLGYADTETTWPTFAEVLRRLHREGILIHPQQLAEFFLRHGLPVDLVYVPSHLKQRAEAINIHYQGEMARLEDSREPPQAFPFE